MQLSPWGDSVEAPAQGQRSPSRIHTKLYVGAAALLAFILVAWGLGTLFPDDSSEANIQFSRGVLPGEFEHHEALLFAWPEKMSSQDERMLSEVITIVQSRLRVVILTPNKAMRQHAKEVLEQRTTSDATSELIHVEAPVESPWARDFGPRIIKSFGGGFEFVGTGFITDDGREAPQNSVSDALGAQFEMENLHAPLVLNGGDLLSNGAGLIVVSQNALARNIRLHGYSKKEVTMLISHHFGAERVLYLATLSDLRIDTFLAFLKPDTLVVGQYSDLTKTGSQKVQENNAKILDRNAALLAGQETAVGPLTVHRIPMPPLVVGKRRSYTDVIFANGLLLTPSFGKSDPAGEKAALAVYQRLLPRWKIQPLPTASLLDGRGPRCLTTGLHRLSDQASDGTMLIPKFSGGTEHQTYYSPRKPHRKLRLRQLIGQGLTAL